jgi:ABC-2 type transport system ATP-binding protein
VVLYTGLVDGMSANEGFFEVEADDIINLMSVLQTHPATKNIVQEQGKVLVYLKENLEAKDLNRFLFENNIVLNHLVKRKNSLEEQFLELTQKK